MPVRLMPATIIDREHIPLWSAKPVDFAVSSTNESGGMWRFVVENGVYNLDPTKADSYGKTNFINPSRTYPFDGNLATAGSEVYTNSTSWVDADAGVDMSTPNRYLILLKVGVSTTSGSACNIGLFGSEDMVTWTLLWSASSSSLATYYALIKPVRCRAVKVMFANSRGGSYYSSCSTYELSLYKV